MPCALCQSANEAEFNVEMMIHFNGLTNIDHPGIPAFSKVLVCLNCGFAQFTVPKTEMAMLASAYSEKLRRPPVGVEMPGCPSPRYSKTELPEYPKPKAALLRA